MEGFLNQLDRFLSSLTLGSTFGLINELHKKEVLTLEEKNLLEAEKGREEEVKRKLIVIVSEKKNKATLKAISRSLQAFKLLYQTVQDSPDVKEEAIKQWKTYSNKSENPGSYTSSPPARTPPHPHLFEEPKGSIESAILGKFEDGTLTHDETVDLLQTAARTCDLPSITNFEGKTLLHLACCQMILETVKLLIETYHVDPCVVDNDGNTALHDACRCEKATVVKYLISLPNCDLNLQNLEGNTPLHVAITHSHFTIGRILLTSSKLNVIVENNDGDTAVTLLRMQIPSAETKKMKRALLNHVSARNMTKAKRQDSLKEFPQISSKPGKVSFDVDSRPLLSDSPVLKRGNFKDAVKAVRKAPTLSLTVPSSLPLQPPPPPTPPLKKKKGVKMSQEVEVLNFEEDVPSNSACEEEEEKEKSDRSVFMNPVFLCVSVTMVIGVLIGLLIITVAGILLFR